MPGPTTTTMPRPTTTTTMPPVTGPSLSIANSGAWEPLKGKAEMLFTVTLSQPVNGKVVASYTTRDGSAQAKLDYLSNKGKVKFKKGQTTATIKVRVVADKVSDPTETFFLDLFDANGATISHGEGVGWIVGG